MTQEQKEDITVYAVADLALIIEKYELLPTKATRQALVEAFQLGIDVMYKGIR